MHRRRFQFLAALGLSLISGLGMAARQSYRRVAVFGDQLETSASVRTNPALGERVVLRKLELGYSKGQHALLALGVLPSAERVDVTLRDRDGGDPFRISAAFARLPDPTPMASRKASGRCKQAATEGCFIAMAVRPRDHEIVLQGFEFQRLKGEAPLRRIAIRPEPERGRSQVVLDGGGGFDVTLVYAYLPRRFVQSYGSVQGRRAQGGPLSMNAKPGTRFLQGFDLRFERGPLPLQALRLDLEGSRINVELAAAGHKDGFRGEVEYAVLNEAALSNQ